MDPWENETLLWHDEFDDTEINPQNWSVDTGKNSGWGNHELQEYTPQNASIQLVDKATCLVITALRERHGWTSARLKSKDRQVFQGGKIEARIKLPQGQGMWPAFWMLGENIDQHSWPACGEIDIMEMVGGNVWPNSDAIVYETLHWGSSREHLLTDPNNFYRLSQGRFSEDFHTFGIDWTPGRIDWYVDGTLRGSHSLRRRSMGTAFQQPFYLLLNLAVGGVWPGYPDETTPETQSMAIDWVRVYR
ncbi:MAG: glycoside hydrolase family 16 protein [Spirochaetales bacterium]|nr:glycoside hydrolase family 16 protein [Spirochaetales bacterium]